ncbi:MAG TPA: ABC transporter ATP-binding protein [Acetobacteraceae bacterium]|nr:ABC transporter ATP-binding protein [Acetobacteraceae bacterium]
MHAFLIAGTGLTAGTGRLAAGWRTGNHNGGMWTPDPSASLPPNPPGAAGDVLCFPTMPDSLLLRDVSAGYGETVVLDGVSLTLEQGGTVSVLGRNGVGKTTLLASVLGHTTLHAGDIAFAGRSLAGLRAFRRARLGIGYVPQEREIFPSLDVEENLTVAARRPRRDGWTTDRVYALFPRLAERRHSMGNQLSGGEQQMLAVGRALMVNPSLLLLDEPLEGLAPVMVDRLLDALRRLRSEAGLAMVLVEQHARLALEFSPRAVILNRGRIAYDGASSVLLNESERLASLIGVSGP